MEYTVGTNWDFDLIDKINYPEVKSVFGGIPDALIASGRSSFMINPIQEENLKNYIGKVHEKGWKFEFNVNSGCIENIELTPAGHKKILKYFEWIESLGVDSVIISIPNLVQIVKKFFPKLEVKISTYQKINSVEMATRFEDMGADAIMLSEHINRDFKLLQGIRNNIKCKLMLIANVGCVYACANMHSHTNSVAHSGAESAINTILTEVYAADCLYKRISNPVELIKSRWIRPEDVGYYEEIGIDMFKIIDRHSSTEALAERMKAYHERSYDGNLIDLLGQIINKKKGAPIDMDRVFNLKNPEDMKKVEKFLGVLNILISDLYYLDNKAIPDDFLEEFKKRDCKRMSCLKCGYCKKIADMVIKKTQDDEQIQGTIHMLKEVKQEILDGSLLY
ncbi:MAG: U32 family peptidase [Spirochaetales bacterium]|nr:U32 family peptidase [Spirochaetales bacterium]